MNFCILISSSLQVTMPFPPPAPLPQYDSPAVLHEVEHDLVQHLLDEGRADPKVSDHLRAEAGQPGQYP